MNTPSKFEAMIQSHPKLFLQIMIILFGLVWNIPTLTIGFILFAPIKKLFGQSWFLLIIVANLLLVSFILLDGLSLSELIKSGFKNNTNLVNAILHIDLLSVISHLRASQIFVSSCSLLFTLFLSLTELIKDNPHLQRIKDLQKGQEKGNKDISESKISQALSSLKNISSKGTSLGVSLHTGKPVYFPDTYLNQIMLVLGTTGAGKTVTLRRFYERAIIQGNPLIIVDGKPDDANIEWLKLKAKKYGRKFYGFNCANYAHYDALAEGGYTELKDKIMSLKDQWDNDHYKSIAEVYLQVVFEVLLASGQRFDLKRVVECLNHDELIAIARGLNNVDLLKRVVELGKFDKKDITGLQAHLYLLIYSELGQYFIPNDNTFSLKEVIEQDAVVYFSLPALRFPTFSTVLGKLVVNDIKATIDKSNPLNKKIFMIFDEFSVFAGQQVLNLVNMGRGKGVHAIFGTQGLADLDAVTPIFKDQVLNCVNTLICHRVNEQNCADLISSWMGTRKVYAVSAQYNPNQIDDGVGTVAEAREFIVHPDDIKLGLRTGDAYWVTKVGAGGCGKVRVVWS